MDTNELLKKERIIVVQSMVDSYLKKNGKKTV